MADLRKVEFVVPSLVPQDPACGECAQRLTGALDGLHGVESVVVDARESRLTVTFDEDILSAALLEEAAERAGVALATGIEHQAYRVTGLDCPD